MKITHWKDLHKLPKKEYLVKSLLDKNALSVVYGQSNSGKTFFVLDIAAHIATGMDWQGLKSKQGSVLYIATEGGLGIGERLRAFEIHHQLKSKGELYILPSGIDLCGEDSTDTDRLIDAVQKLGAFSLIIVDTLNRAMSGGDENSSRDMGSFVRNCDKIRENTKAHVLIVHHSGKDSGKGARGHSSLKAAVDTEIEVQNKSGDLTIKTRKQRDGKKDISMTFNLKVIDLGTDADGDKISSCALVKGRDTLTGKKTRLNGQTKRALDILYDLIIEKSKPYSPKNGMPKQNCVMVSDFREALEKNNISASENISSVRKAVSRAIDSLNEKQVTATYGDYIWIPNHKS